MSDPVEKLPFHFPKEIMELILSQFSLLAKNYVTLALIGKQHGKFSHHFWRNNLYSLFPNITLYNPPFTKSTPEEETQFF